MPRGKKKAEPVQPPQGANASAALRRYVDRLERLEEEKKVIADDMKDVLGEAKGEGFDTKAIKRIMAERKQDRETIEAFEDVIHIYRVAMGMVPDGEPEEEADDSGEGLV